jgi:hypothetical protein
MFKLFHFLLLKLLTVVDDDVHGARVLITTGGGTVGL